MKVMQAKDWTAVMEAVAQVMTEQADHLCEMDARMGDGDLGLTMKKGYCALPEIYAGLEEADMGKRLSKAGMKMSSVVPSTMGTLMSSGWMEGGKRLVGKEEVDASAFAAASGSGLEDTAAAALEGAKRGLEATKEMTPKYGKAAVFAAKALGTEDQGATAGMLLVQGLYNGIQK